jgi:hypothetical protein
MTWPPIVTSVKYIPERANCVFAILDLRRRWSECLRLLAARLAKILSGLDYYKIKPALLRFCAFIIPQTLKDLGVDLQSRSIYAARALSERRCRTAPEYSLEQRFGQGWFAIASPIPGLTEILIRMHYGSSNDKIPILPEYNFQSVVRRKLSML